MAKKQTFADKMVAASDSHHCPVCNTELQFVKHVKAVKTESGVWKFRSQNKGVCKCNEKEVYV